MRAMDRPNDFPKRLSPEQVRQAMAAADSLDEVLRRCAMHAASQLELVALLAAK